jgi:PrtD family type I secretion system ABC transporter
MSWLFSRALRPFMTAALLASLLMNLMMLGPSLYMLQVFDRVFSSGSLETLTMLTLLVSLSLALVAAMDVLRARLLAWASTVLDRRIGPQVLETVLDDAAHARQRRNPYSVRDVALLRGFLGGGGIFALFDAPWFPIYLAVIFAFHPWLGWTALLGAILLFGLILLTDRMTRRPIDRLTGSTRSASRFIDAAMRNAEVVAGMGMGTAVVQRWTGLNQEVTQEQMALQRVQSRLQAAVKVLRMALQVAMLGVGAWLVLRQEASAGVMVAGSILLSKALQPVEQLVSGWRSLVEARSAWSRLQDESLQTPSGERVELPQPAGRLDLERVVFQLPSQSTALVKGISLSLAPGESLGIIGPSGSGKTSLLRLLLGIWRPQSGVVRLDGADIAVWGRDRMGQHVGYLPQDIELFAGTVAENIARLRQPDSQAVIQAAQLAGAHELILRLPYGYETEVGEGGAALSGGQRQRIALARALYGDPCLVVLDEPNSNLDAEGEAALAGALLSLRERRRTVVMVGHRPSMMVGMSRLAILRDGSLEALGTPAEVMARYQKRGTSAQGSPQALV